MYVPTMSPKPLKAQAVEVIKEAIIRGELKDNEVISERIAKESFGISRTPYREAIQILEATQWVYTIPYTGTYVRPITMEDINEVFEMRMLIELALAKHLQTANVSFARMKELTNQMEDQMAQLTDYEFMCVDNKFHFELYRLTNNNRLIAIFEEVSDAMLRISSHLKYPQERRLITIREHNEIIAALEEENGNEGVVLAHLEKAKKALSDLLQARNKVI